MANDLQIRVVTPEEMAEITDIDENSVYLVKNNSIDGNWYVDYDNERITINSNTADQGVNFVLPKAVSKLENDAGYLSDLGEEDNPTNVVKVIERTVVEQPIVNNIIEQVATEIDETKLVPNYSNYDIGKILMVTDNTSDPALEWVEHGGSILPLGASNGEILLASGGGPYWGPRFPDPEIYNPNDGDILSYNNGVLEWTTNNLPEIIEQEDFGKVLKVNPYEAIAEWGSPYPTIDSAPECIDWLDNLNTALGTELPSYELANQNDVLVYNGFESEWASILPDYSSAADGSTLQVINGELTWVAP